MKILIVDDNQDQADSLAMILRMSGHEVETAYDGPAGLATVDAFLPRIVIQDIGMPGMNGFEVSRKVREKYTKDQITIVALTGGFGNEEHREIGRQAGICHHMTKPADFDKLNELLVSYERLAQQRS